MADCMTFPDTIEEFMEQYKIVDTKKVYTNGSELISIFRMKQWFEHLAAMREPKKGQWIPHNEKTREYIGTVLVNVEYKYWFCNSCGYRIENGQPMYNFCPNCGADMRGDNNE